MAGFGPEDLHDLAGDFLAACVESLDTIPSFAPGLGGAPERSFVSPGIPVWDCCEMLAVYAASVGHNDTSPGGLASGRRDTYGAINLVQLVATVTRCVPTVGATALDEIPLIADLEVAAAQINADGWALWNHLYNMKRAGTLLTRCSEVYWDALSSVAPSGGCGGWTLVVRAQLDGYED